MTNWYEAHKTKRIDHTTLREGVKYTGHYGKERNTRGVCGKNRHGTYGDEEIARL